MNMTEMFMETCNNTLNEHDGDGDGMINRTEYVNIFFNLLGVPVPPGFEYSMLPLELVSAFNSAACAQCDDLPAIEYSGCCDEDSAIDITDPEIVESLCLKFRDRLGAYRPSEVPSSIPSPSPSMLPSQSPTDLPTMVPSVNPSDVPTLSPSVSPSDVPTLSPSASPSDVPTSKPTDAPSFIGSQYPTITSTSAPSSSPSDGPTSLPSILQTPAPVELPSDSPSSQPSCSQTAEAIVIEVRYPLTTNPGVDANVILSSDGNTVLVDLVSATSLLVNQTIAASTASASAEQIGEQRRGVQDYHLKARQMLDPTPVVSARAFSYAPYFGNAVIDNVEDVPCDVDDLQYATSSDVNCTVVTSSITVFGYCDTDMDALTAQIMSGLFMTFAGNMFCDFV